jgi:hypothetical protein
MGGLDSEAEDMARQGEIEVWDADRFQREVGRAIITEISGGDDKTASADSPSAPGEAGGRDSPRAGGCEALLTGVDVLPALSYGDPGYTGPPAVPAQAGSGAPASAGPGIPEGMESKVMRIHLSRPDAQDLSRKIEAYNFDLQLIPYYIFDYTCELTVEGQGDVQHNNGTLGINGLTLRHEQWPTSYETVETLDLPHTRLNLRYGYSDARSTVDSAVIALNTKVVETVEERESATVIERKKVRPKEDALEISSRGIVYLPVWCIEGRNGVMIIDGASGNILKEETFKSRETVVL